MKNFIRCILCIFSLSICILTFCGCESNKKDIESLLTSLKKQNIISDSMKQIDIQTHKFWESEWCSKEIYHIYKDKNSKIIAIKYDNKKTYDVEYDHFITIYYDVTINDNIDFIDSEYVDCDNEHYIYENEEKSKNNKYEFGTKKEYYATKKSSLFKGTYYFLEEVK